MSDPIQQHIVPRFILENFVDQEGHLHCFDKATNRIYRTSPDKALRERHIYSLSPSQGDERYDVESKLGVLEYGFKPLLDWILKVVRRGNRPCPAEELVELTSVFFSVQHRRSRPNLHRFYENKEDFIDDVADEIDRNYTIKSADGIKVVSVRDVMSESDWDDRFRNTLAKTIVDPGYAAFSGKGFAVGLVKNPKKSLVIGDCPIIYTHPKVATANDPPSEFVMPVAKDVAIFLVGDVDHRGVSRIDDETVNRMNHRIAKQSDVIACPSHALAEAIRKRLAKRI